MRREMARAAAVLWVGLATSQPAWAKCQIALIADLPVTMEGPRATIPVRINGIDTRLWLDSGAFFSFMPAAKAAELKLPLKPVPAWGFRISGIGGSAAVEMTTVKSFGFAKADLHDVDFFVGGSDAGNGLIGRNILALADTEFDLAHGSVKLFKSTDCPRTNFAYWAPTSYFTVPLISDDNPVRHELKLPVTLNGRKVIAAIDSGSPVTLVSRAAIERAGIDLKGPGVARLHGVSGVGRHVAGGWVVSVDNVGIGDEHVLRADLEVLDGPIDESKEALDMLLGADFLLAHHLYVARSIRTIFFTYGGGKPFTTALPARAIAATSAASTPLVPTGMHRVEAVNDPLAEPKTAEQFALRGAARLSQDAIAGAIADYTAAIRLDPRAGDYYHGRAEAYARDERFDLAASDLDQAIALGPATARLLGQRATLRLKRDDRAGALADAEAAARLTPPASLEALGVAGLFERLGKPDHAISLVSGVIAAHGDDAKLGAMLNIRCWMRGLANVELDQALDDCDRAIKRDGANPAFLDSRALVYLRKRDLASARADYDAALAQNDKMAWSHYLRGAVKAAQGDAAGAAADRARAEEIDPKIAEDAARYGLGTR